MDWMRRSTHSQGTAGVRMAASTGVRPTRSGSGPAVRRAPGGLVLLGTTLLLASVPLSPLSPLAPPLAPAALSAQAPPSEPLADDTIPRFTVPGVAVTVTRSELRRDEIPQRVDLISATDLERTPMEELPDLLKKLAAVDVVQFPGLLSGVGIRGFRPQTSGINQRTLLLVDGRPAGVSNLSLLPVHSVERIEVLKGPASALYGSNAMGGVVNIVTRRSSGAAGGSVTASYGSWSTSELRGFAGGTVVGDLDFDLGFSAFDRGDDFRIGGGNLFRDMLGGETVARIGQDGTVTEVTDAGDGDLRPFTSYSTRAGNLRVGYRIFEDLRLDLRGEHFGADRVQTPGDIHAAFDNRALKNVGRSSGEVGLSGVVGRHALTARAYLSWEDSDAYNVPEAGEGLSQFVSFRSLNRWRGVQIQDVVALGHHSLTAGVDYSGATAESERFVSGSERGAPFEPDSEIRSVAAFAQGRFALLDERVLLTLAGRFDNVAFEVFETELLPSQIPDRETTTVVNPSAGLQYRTDTGLRLRTSAGRGFVTPQAFQVAGRSERRVEAGAGTIDLTRGNPELRPENSITWDAGIGFLDPDRGLDLDLGMFVTNVRDRITSSRTDAGEGELTPAGDTVRSITTYINADEARLRGIEASASYDLGTRAGSRYMLRAFLNGTRMFRAEETTAGVTERIQNVADLSLNYGLEYDDLDRLALRLTGRYVGERRDTDWSDWTNPAQVAYPAFMTLDLASTLRLTDRYHAGLQVTNLTDEHFYEVRGYPLPGRAVRLSATVRF